ncbi:unnamed protein product [Psylliodes chrysocephalus]|uniref:Uncharacterized protein n=1 Tax=Psylliodes chrysocephalus TaxID=3402493 RepID=A0A9P0G743_9CUCU|nr:unnamed protein product [Psylliodes chrysocephala]
MIVTLRVALLVIFIDFCLSKDVVVFPGKINDFALYNTNLFAIPTPLPADQVVAQALVEEVSGDTEELDNDYPSTKKENSKVSKNEEASRDYNIAADRKTTDKDIAKDEKAVETKIKENTDENKEHDKIEQIKKQYKGKKGHKSAKFGEKKGHKKGHKTKGYNNRFHKDEYHKEHKLYGDGYRDNSKNAYRGSHLKHANKDKSYKKSKQKTHSHKDNKFGKKGVDDVGKFDDQHQDFDKKSGHANKDIHHVSRIKIKDEQNPHPNHRQDYIYYPNHRPS